MILYLFRLFLIKLLITIFARPNIIQLKSLFLFSILLFCSWCHAQTTIDFDEHTSNQLYTKLYGQIDYNQKIESGKRNAGLLDVHRVVVLFGYQFNRNTQFVSEIEIEHVKELFIEQAYVKHRIAKGINLKTGLLIIPMGLVNETHEPTFFYSVERPLLDKNIIPSTWREIGLGISGIIQKQNLKYQFYLVNNPISYNNGPRINAASGIRSARQKAAESIITSWPGITGQIEYFGIENTKIGLSTFYGKTNTSLYNTLEQIDEASNALIDSSTLKISLTTINATFNKKRYTARGQYSLLAFGDTAPFNQLTNSDVPQLMHGFYVLLAYDLLKNDIESFSPFVRFSHINQQLKLSSGQTKNRELSKNIITLGINYKPHPGVVFKADYQIFKINSGQNYQQFNTGVGVWF